MTSQPAVFRVYQEPFQVTGRGLAVLCEYESGDVRLGQRVEVRVANNVGPGEPVYSAIVESARVKGVPGEELPALLFGAAQDAEVTERLRALLQPGAQLLLSASP